MASQAPRAPTTAQQELEPPSGVTSLRPTSSAVCMPASRSRASTLRSCQPSGSSRSALPAAYGYMLSYSTCRGTLCCLPCHLIAQVLSSGKRHEHFFVRLAALLKSLATLQRACFPVTAHCTFMCPKEHQLVRNVLPCAIPAFTLHKATLLASQRCQRLSCPPCQLTTHQQPSSADASRQCCADAMCPLSLHHAEACPSVIVSY